MTPTNLYLPMKQSLRSAIAYFFFVLLVRTAAAFPEYVLLHAVCIQLGHTTGDFTD